jgi:hypothetical protein
MNGRAVEGMHTWRFLEKLPNDWLRSLGEPTLYSPLSVELPLDVSSSNASGTVNESVLDAIYEAATGITSWGIALTGLNQVLCTSGVQLVVVDKKNGTLIRSDHPSSGVGQNMVDSILEHVREWHRHDFASRDTSIFLAPTRKSALR